MSKHTPGPWHIGGRTILRPTLTIFHKPFGLGDVAEVHEEADARLIAAAPLLYEALRAAVADWDEEVSRGRWLDAARAAIKAVEENT